MKSLVLLAFRGLSSGKIRDFLKSEKIFENPFGKKKLQMINRNNEK